MGEDPFLCFLGGMFEDMARSPDPVSDDIGGQPIVGTVPVVDVLVNAVQGLATQSPATQRLRHEHGVVTSPGRGHPHFPDRLEHLFRVQTVIAEHEAWVVQGVSGLAVAFDDLLIDERMQPLEDAV